MPVFLDGVNLLRLSWAFSGHSESIWLEQNCSFERCFRKEMRKVFESPEGSVVWIGKERPPKKKVLSQTLLNYKILWSRLTSSWTNVSKNKLDSLPWLLPHSCFPVASLAPALLLLSPFDLFPLPHVQTLCFVNNAPKIPKCQLLLKIHPSPEPGLKATMEFKLWIWVEVRAVMKDFPKPEQDQKTFIEEFRIPLSA